MEISNELKDNLITDVEHTIGLDLSSAQINALERAFEITIGHAISALSLPQPERKTAEGIKYFINSVYDKIREDLSSAYLINYRDEDGNGYPLLDHLSNTNIITSGREEIDNIIEQIEIDELLTKYTHTYAVQGIDWPSEEPLKETLIKFLCSLDEETFYSDRSADDIVDEWLLNRVKQGKEVSNEPEPCKSCKNKAPENCSTCKVINGHLDGV